MPPMPSRSKLMSKCISLFQWSIGHMHVCVGWKGHVSFGKAINGCPCWRPNVVLDHTTGTALHTCIGSMAGREGGRFIGRVCTELVCSTDLARRDGTATERRRGLSLALACWLLMHSQNFKKKFAGKQIILQLKLDFIFDFGFYHRSLFLRLVINLNGKQYSLRPITFS